MKKTKGNPVPSFDGDTMNEFLMLLKNESIKYLKKNKDEGKMTWNDTQVVTRFLTEFINDHFSEEHGFNYQNGRETDKEQPKCHCESLLPKDNSSCGSAWCPNES